MKFSAKIIHTLSQQLTEDQFSGAMRQYYILLGYELPIISPRDGRVWCDCDRCQAFLDRLYVDGVLKDPYGILH